MSLVAIAVAAVVALVGVAILAVSGRNLWDALRIYRGEPVAVADVVNDPGPAELQGVAQADAGTVRSPFSDSECLVCEWAVEREYVQDELADSEWEPVVEGLVGGPFALEDGTARCRVEPAGSDRQLQPHRVSVPHGSKLLDHLAAFAADYPAIETRPNDGGNPTAARNYRFVERRLDVGEECYVYGYAHYESGVGSGGGWVNVVVNGDGVRRFLLADTRARGVAWTLTKTALGGVVAGLAVLAGSVLAYVVFA